MDVWLTNSIGDGSMQAGVTSPELRDTASKSGSVYKHLPSPSQRTGTEEFAHVACIKNPIARSVKKWLLQSSSKTNFSAANFFSSFVRHCLNSAASFQNTGRRFQTQKKLFIQNFFFPFFFLFFNIRLHRLRILPRASIYRCFQELVLIITHCCLWSITYRIRSCARNKWQICWDWKLVVGTGQWVVLLFEL